jgi:hypothetical protein
MIFYMMTINTLFKVILAKQMMISKMHLHIKMEQTSKLLILPITHFIKIKSIFHLIFLILLIIVQLMKVHLAFIINTTILSITIITSLLSLIKMKIRFLDKYCIKEIY